MSIARVQERTARQEYKCEKSGDVIHRGEKYRWFKVGFRSKYKHIRCMKVECTPKRSELDSSKMSSVWSSQESALSELRGMEGGSHKDHDQEELDQVVHEFGDAIQEVADEYKEAAENFGESGPSQERAEALEEVAEALSQWSSDEHELVEPEENESGMEEEEEDWECNWDELVAAAIDEVEGVEV